jgi:hypothetical protein
MLVSTPEIIFFHKEKQIMNAKQDAELSIAELVAELTGEEPPLADMNTKAVTLRIVEYDITRAECLARFGKKKRASILKAVISIGIDCVIAALTLDDQAKIEEIRREIMREEMEAVKEVVKEIV